MKISRFVLAVLLGASLSAGWAADEPQGNVAAGAVDKGNPLKVGGKYNATPPTLDDGDRGDVQLDASGNLRVTLGTGSSAIGTVTAVGSAADGAAVAGNPVRIGGKDGSGNTQDLITDTSGNLSVGTGTAGTAAANVVTVQGIASATPVVVGGSVASGAADSGNPVKAGGKYNLSLPVYTDGQRGDLQLDASGRVRVTHRSAVVADGDGAVNSKALLADELGTALYTQARLTLLNGSSTWDRARAGIVTPTATLTGHANVLPWAVYNATPTTRTEGQGGPLQATAQGSLVVKTYAAPDNDWSYVAASTGITNTTTAVTIKAAAAAGVRNYITGLQISSDVLGTATELAIRDGAGGAVLWRMKIGTTGIINGLQISFHSPIRGTAATLLEVVTLTASGTGAVYVNAQGYAAP
ncbi:MAG TPA: hypothetical protein VLJ58_21410 [Ramlibacter sp.]|nr:hypothetical protein [Ramlibacter sp.]